MFSIESPHRGDSNEYTQYTIFNIKKKKITLNYSKLQLWYFSKGLKNEFETAVVNEPSGFELLKFYCSWNYMTESQLFAFLLVISFASLFLYQHSTDTVIYVLTKVKIG